MGTRLKLKPISSAVLSAALCLSATARAQDTSSAPSAQNTNNTAKAGATADEFPDLVEIDPFGGVSLYGQVNTGLGTKIVDGGVAGIRVAWNPARYIGIEGFFDYAQ